METIDRIIYAAVFFALGWSGCLLRERRAAPRPRRADKGQDGAAKPPRKPRTPRAAKVPPLAGEQLPMD